MYKDKKIVCVTPAGRREYMEILFPYIIKNRHIVDEYQIWLNTKNEEDIKFILDFASQHDFVTVCKEGKEEHLGKNDNIRYFFNKCIEPNTVYIRFDDDIVFIEDGFFEKFLDFRISNPDYFLVYPLIINNHWCTWKLQKNNVVNYGKTKLDHWEKLLAERYNFLAEEQDEPRLHHYFSTDQILCSLLWGNPDVAYDLHSKFINDIKNKNLDKYRFGVWNLNHYQSVSINCISWLGEEFAKFNGEVASFEEETWLSTFKPIYAGKKNCVFGDAIIGHYSYYAQREALSTTDILKQYKELINEKI